MVKIAVLGGGINGLTCAVKIKEKYKDFQVVLISSEFTPDTTGDGSGGLWYPYLCGNTPASLLEKWGGETYKYLQELWESGGYGVSLMPIYDLYRDKDLFNRPDWTNIVFGYLELNSKQLEYFSQLYSVRYNAGQTFMTLVAPAPTLLSNLQDRFKQAHGELLQRKVTSFHDPLLQEYDVIVNCTGLGARWLVPDDKVVPIRGQIAKVEAQWINETVIDEDGGNYVIPNAEFCVMGGSHQHEYNTQVYPTDTDFIINGCQKMMPGLKHAKIIHHWVGLRPGRDAIRLEAEQKNGKLYIHNYGHGGSGLTLFWGCGNEVLRILESNLNKINTCNISSKL